MDWDTALMADLHSNNTSNYQTPSASSHWPAKSQLLSHQHS